MAHTHSSTVEQYVKCIFLVGQYSKDRLLPMHAITEEMSVAPSTATAMMKYLQKEGLIRYTQRKGVALTAAGEKLALRILRRHRLIETFLAEVLKYDGDEVHADAEQLEHVVSDTFIDKIEAHMNYPLVDPHGSPIPAKDGQMSRGDRYTLLAQGTVGRIYEIKRITGDSATTAREFARNSLQAGTMIKIVENNPQLDVMKVELVDERRTVSVGLRLTSLVMLKER